MASPGVRRLVLWIEYEGTDFNGWQVQPGQRTVQGEFEAALAKMCDAPVRLIGSGRTDSGVHAFGQVAHFDTKSNITPEKFRLGLNTLNGRDVTVFDCREAADPFHAQFDALRKTYRYRILNRCPPSALRRDRAWHIRAPLDTGAMRRAADSLLGEHDFASFRAAGGGETTTVRALERLEVRKEADEVVLEAEAGGFLRHMVRNIAGTLAEVGRGARAPGSIPGLLAARDRTQAAPTAPARGLYLVRVDYGAKMPPPAPSEIENA